MINWRQWLRREDRMPGLRQVLGTEEGQNLTAR